MTAHMERLMQRMGQTDSGFGPQRILELNPNHETIVALQALHEKDKDDSRIESYARLLYDQAVLTEGSKLNDPASLAERINALIARDANSGSGD